MTDDLRHEGGALDFESYWADIRPRPYPQMAFRWPDLPRGAVVGDGKGIEELAEQLGVAPEVLSPPGAPRDGPRTISVWFRTTTGEVPLVSHVRDEYRLQLVDGQVVFEDSRSGSRVRSLEAFNDGQWHHIVVVSDPEDSPHPDIYVDGVVVNVQVEGPLNGGVDDAPVALEPNDFNLSEAAIWDRELTPEELAAIYNRGEPPDIASDGNLSSGLVGWWRLDGAQVPGELFEGGGRDDAPVPLEPDEAVVAPLGGAEQQPESE